ncbi:MAG: glutathione S-transferase, partial [Caballeronia sp.]|nr:glutathione S-transferase [Caballeronia sp.]
NLAGSSRPTADVQATAAREKIGQRFRLIGSMMKGKYLFGEEASAADPY